MGKEGGSTVIAPQLADIRAKSFIHALSEIQQFSAVEYRVNLPDGVIPMLPKLSFVDIAFRVAGTTTAYAFLMMPFSLAVTTKILTVFGTSNPSLLDKIFAYCLSASPTIAITLLIMFVLTTKVYAGKTTKEIIQNFVVTFISVKITVSFMSSIVILFLYNVVFTKELIIEKGFFLIDKFAIGNNELVIKFFNFLLEFREIIPKAVVYSVILHVGTSFLLLYSYLYVNWKSKKLEVFRREWE